MNNHPFGPTKCVRAFYHESMAILQEINWIPTVRTRRVLREAYIAHRINQFINDVDLGAFDTSVGDEIVERMDYVLRQGSRNLLK